jgi:hypothetical protein
VTISGTLYIDDCGNNLLEAAKEILSLMKKVKLG